MKVIAEHWLNREPQNQHVNARLGGEILGVKKIDGMIAVFILEDVDGPTMQRHFQVWSSGDEIDMSVELGKHIGAAVFEPRYDEGETWPNTVHIFDKGEGL